MATVLPTPTCKTKHGKNKDLSHKHVLPIPTGKAKHGKTRTCFTNSMHCLSQPAKQNVKKTRTCLTNKKHKTPTTSASTEYHRTVGMRVHHSAYKTLLLSLRPLNVCTLSPTCVILFYGQHSPSPPITKKEKQHQTCKKNM